MANWKEIEGYSGRYSVSDDGRVRSNGWQSKRGNHVLNIAGKVLKNSCDSNGYAVVNLHLPNKVGQVKCYVHRLVAEAFLGKPPDDRPQVAHWDGNGMNASVSNLRWVSQSENEADKRRHGRDFKAAKGSRLFSSADVAWLRRQHEGGDSLRDLAIIFGTTHNVVKNAIENGSAI